MEPSRSLSRTFSSTDPSRKRDTMIRRSVICVALSLLSLPMLFVRSSCAQTVPPLDKIQNQQELDSAITALDAALFDAYNKCDLDKFASYIDENVEFYHDQGGVTLGRAALTDSVKKNICGKVTRELVPGALQDLPHERLRRRRNRSSPLPPSRPRRHRRDRRSRVHSPLAIQRRRLEDHPRNQLRPPLRR